MSDGGYKIGNHSVPHFITFATIEMEVVILLYFPVKGGCPYKNKQSDMT